jgi:Flp pilus assembly protein TadD
MEMDKGNDREAARLFIESLRIEPTKVALTNLAFVGRRMFTNKDNDGARTALEALRSFDPALPDPYLLIADMQMRNGQADSALVQLDRLIALAPGNADAHRMRGEVLAVYLGRTAQAEDSFKRALELDPRNVNILDNLGVAAFTRGDKQAALTYFLQAAEVEPGNAHILLNVARTYGALGDEGRAQEYLARSQAAGGGAR